MTHPHAESRALLALQNAATLAKQANNDRQLAWVALYLASISGSANQLEKCGLAYIEAQKNYVKRKAAYAMAWDAYTMGGVQHD